MSNANEAAMPRHLGLILDGNRRWAREHGLPIYEGHKAGYRNVERILEAAIDRGVEYVSIYAFSTENWNRSADEVRQLMKLLLWIFRHELANLKRHGVRVHVLGNKLRIGKALLRAVHNAEQETKDNKRGTLLFCLDYGGQQEIVEAMKELMAEGVTANDLTAERISERLQQNGVPPVDLIIRTSGEQRLSNFMLWQAAYSEFMFTSTKWPDFSVEEFNGMLDAYAQRHRRFGQ
ncbi:MAG TPA: polyprenyl diphosphate synthase [Candidatus Saccharimonadales bacterium]|nr:polyprenyl diphosphate synthase [Candidatus Saccharimonadales bacterium]